MFEGQYCTKKWWITRYFRFILKILLFSTKLNTSVLNNDFKPFSFDFLFGCPRTFLSYYYYCLLIFTGGWLWNLLYWCLLVVVVWYDSVALVLDLKLCAAGQLICNGIYIGAGLGVDAWCDRTSFPDGLMDVCRGGALVLLCWCLLVLFLGPCAGLGLSQFWGISLDLKLEPAFWGVSLDLNLMPAVTWTQLMMSEG